MSNTISDRIFKDTSEKKILNKLYNCEFVSKDEYLDINFFTGIEIEGILKLVKWLFLEQDVTYWNYSGRVR